MLPRLQRLRVISRNKSAKLARLYSQVCWLGQYNAGLVVQTNEANTLVTDMGERQRTLEEELAQAANERDAQRATAERKAELQGKEAELQHEKATIATLSATLTERDAALAKAAARSAEAVVKEKEAFLSILQEQANTA